jgi:hypothetical protein
VSSLIADLLKSFVLMGVSIGNSRNLGIFGLVIGVNGIDCDSIELDRLDFIRLFNCNTTSWHNG